MLDTVIVGGTLIDGTGAPARPMDIGVNGGRIVSLGQLDAAEAHMRIDATGAIVCPGFIDAHSHSDLALLADPTASAKTGQGVTTEIVGNCGWGAAPVSAAITGAWRQAAAGVLGDPDLCWTWSSIAEYLAELAARQPAVNVATLVPHGAVRHFVMGMRAGPPTPTELDRMIDVVDGAMGCGALGLSAGLVYPPGVFSAVDELEALAHVVARRGGLLAVHLRSYGRQLLAALDEMIGLARRAAIRLHISHLSIVGQVHASLAEPALECIDAARASGIDVTFDQQPYPAASSTLSLLLPSWMTVGGADATLRRLSDPVERQRLAEVWSGMGDADPFFENYVAHCGWERIIVGSVSGARSAEGVVGASMATIAAQRGVPPAEVAMDLWREHAGEVTIVLLDLFPASTVDLIFQHPITMVVTDAVVCAGLPHPRLYGTYARVLGTFVRERRLASLETAIRKMTSLPAERFGLHGRGAIRQGMAADLVVFEADRIRDTATYRTPTTPPLGIRAVLVNGQRAGSAAVGEIYRSGSGARAACTGASKPMPDSSRQSIDPQRSHALLGHTSAATEGEHL
jgi:N-acyl-D-aspartate/D-glutamate deacylase